MLLNLRQLLWVGADGKGNFRNDEQKAAATPGPLCFSGTNDLLSIVNAVKPSCLIGAVGRDPGCFSQRVIRALVSVNPTRRPVVFALSNPKTQAEVTAADAYAWSDGQVIYGSGTAMPSTDISGVTRKPGQVLR